MAGGCTVPIAGRSDPYDAIPAIDARIQENLMHHPFRALTPIILASGSPRRRQFLEELGLAFELVRPQGIEPRPVAGEAPEKYARRAAAAKAHAVPRRPESLLLAADTIVALDGDILGKPRDTADALAMLRRLAGRAHTVTSAVCCLLPDGEEVRFHDTTTVTFHPWPEEALAAYARTGEPLDKAGAYAIQGLGAFLTARIEGSWSTVVGLPVTPLAALLLERGIIAPALSGVVPD